MTRMGQNRFIIIVVAIAMFAAAILARNFTPTIYLTSIRPKFTLETLVPTAFDEWRIDASITPLVVDPSQLELSSRLYSQTLARTYVNKSGHRVMLSIAYGPDQSNGLQVHTPESCYPVAGFTTGPSREESIAIDGIQQPVVRLNASKPGFLEHITYWVTVGDYIVNNGPKGRRDVRFKYGFDGTIPDGLLFRLSSVGLNEAIEYELQRQFLVTLHQNLTKEATALLFGKQAYGN